MSRTGGGFIRDERKNPFVMIAVELIDRFGPLIGANGLAVYNVLARYANRTTHRTFVSLEMIAAKLNISQPTVSRAVKLLIEYRLVHRDSGKLKGTPTEYILRDVPREKLSDSAPLFEDQPKNDEGGKSPVTYPTPSDQNLVAVCVSYEDEHGGSVTGDLPPSVTHDLPGSVTGDLPGKSNLGGRVSQKRISYKEEPDRSFNQIKPTTTETAVVVGPVVEQMVDVLAQYVSTVEQVAVEKLISSCHKICPDATVGEIVYFVHRKGKAMLRMGREQTSDFTTTPILRNPMGFLLSTVPKCFEGAAFAAWRKKAAETALKEKPRAEGPGELDLLALQPGWTRKAQNPWTPVVDALQVKINQHSFDTWFKPTRYAGEIGETLFVAVPSAEFQTIGERYSTEILEAIESLGLNFEDVKFVVPPEVEQKAAGG